MSATDEQLRALVGYNIKRANSGIFAGVEGTLAPFGLRRTTYSALSVIAENAEIRQSDLAAVLAIERPNLVQILDELQSAGLISRARDENDRRVYLLAATPDGIERVAAASESLRAYDDRLTKGMSPDERAALIAALRRIEDNGPEAWEGRNVEQVSTP
ncbi:MarR family winged helix-turn-helix transcriptional regulator [Gymnodinialimonas ceratoperidinii]|uniref:MarR family transcriptional regulator n=1 Tax=Gymnodinialimonas ceratoperidinii TaxID=2856823 RepID=A0A8F6TX72_9RHOB|nr:MarR family transcriptional regulator [Gymnodinialimonas ceratoperidinii]QXT39584.1 MarR family transcriptional regulator [Gymnodinialimonas ceratoperidinii]